MACSATSGFDYGTYWMVWGSRGWRFLNRRQGDQLKRWTTWTARRGLQLTLVPTRRTQMLPAPPPLLLPPAPGRKPKTPADPPARPKARLRLNTKQIGQRLRHGTIARHIPGGIVLCSLCFHWAGQTESPSYWHRGDGIFCDKCDVLVVPLPVFPDFEIDLR